MRYLIFSCCLLLFGQVTLSQNLLDAATKQLLADPQFGHGSIGIAVLDVATGRIVRAHNINQSFVPASLLKVTTTATALEVLGADYRFETKLVAAGPIVDGVLQGDLLIVGGGDPSLGGGRPDGVPELDDLLSRWATAVADAGITRIEGSVLGEESLAPGAEPSPYWQWNDIGNYYGAGAGALMINENQYTLRLKQTAREGGQPAVVGYAPDPGELRWQNQLRSGPRGSGDQSYIYGAPGSADRVIRGTIPAGSGEFTVKGSLPNPAEHTAVWLTKAIRLRGIAVSGLPGTAQRPDAAQTGTVIDVYSSPTLAELVKLTNYRSVNLFAEALFAALARQWGTADSPSDTGDKLEAHWEARGIDVDGFDQVDGSGLSMRSLITPRQMVNVLRLSASSGFAETLPRVGSEGTVRSLLRGNSRAGRIRAKSGTLMRSRGFCGYATAADGTELAFMVTANNFSGSGSRVRRAMATWMAALVE